MRNILLTISYDGTNFCGWQRQDQKTGEMRTVQGEIEKALEEYEMINYSYLFEKEDGLKKYF